MSARFRAAGWAWADHLRAGGTTPWLGWLASQPATAGAAGAGPTGAGSRGPGSRGPGSRGAGSRGAVPGAAQLELVRRLAERKGAAGPDVPFTELADLALSRSGPGRGPATLRLVWPEDDRPPRHGPPPADPATVPVDELLRVGVGLLAELLLRSPRPAAPVSAGRRRLPWHRAFHVTGAPVSAARLRAELAAAGHVQGGRRPDVVVLAEPLDVLLGQVWSRRVQAGDSVRWPTFLRRWAGRDALPPAADLAATARHWADRVGPGRVHVVTAPDARRTAAGVLGLSVGEAAATRPASLSPDAVDVLRRLNRVLNVRADDDVRRRARRHATDLLADGRTGDAPELTVPRPLRDWLDERAAVVTDDLRAGGYAVHGDLARITPRHGGPVRPRRPEMLALVLDTCLRAAGPSR